MSKWNTRAMDFKVWQVAKEVGRFKQEISLQLMNAIAQPPVLGDKLAMEDPNDPGETGHCFEVVDMHGMGGNYWMVGLTLIPRPGFDSPPSRITPLAYHEPIKQNQDA